MLSLSQLADDLKNDMIAAGIDSARADKAVAYARPGAAGAGIVSLFAGHGWLGLAFGAAALSARAFANDWKAAKASEYQAKWTAIMANFSREEAAVFAAIFAHKYPLLANKLCLE